MGVEDWRKKLEKLYINVIIIEEETYVKIKEITGIKQRGVEELFMISMINNKWIKKIIKMSYPEVIMAPSIVEFYNKTGKYIARRALREIGRGYRAENQEEAVESFKEKYKTNKILMKKFENNIESMINLYNYSLNIRKLIYTTNAIESVNSCLRKVTNGKGCFVNIEALEKALYLRVKELSNKWNRNKKSNWPII